MERQRSAFRKAGEPRSCFPLWKTFLVGWPGGGRLEDVFEHERHPVGGNLGERWRIILSFQMCLERL